MTREKSGTCSDILQEHSVERKKMIEYLFRRRSFIEKVNRINRFPRKKFSIKQSPNKSIDVELNFWFSWDHLLTIKFSDVRLNTFERIRFDHHRQCFLLENNFKSPPVKNFLIESIVYGTMTNTLLILFQNICGFLRICFAEFSFFA